MAFEELIKNKKAFVFGLDNVIYPEKDYLLQVYYLFGEFMSYTEQMDAKAILTFMQTAYTTNGSEGIFKAVAEQFNIPVKYESNFSLLHQNARLPLKLLLYKDVLALLQEIVVERKEIFLLVDGDPVQALNKIKQMEWHGLAGYLKLYFTAEFSPKPNSDSLNYLMHTHQLERGELVMIGNSDLDRQQAEHEAISYFSIDKLL